MAWFRIYTKTGIPTTIADKIFGKKALLLGNSYLFARKMFILVSIMEYIFKYMLQWVLPLGPVLAKRCTNINKIKFCFAKAKSTEDALLEL